MTVLGDPSAGTVLMLVMVLSCVAVLDSSTGRTTLVTDLEVGTVPSNWTA